jgi:hypothetical protein
LLPSGCSARDCCYYYYLFSDSGTNFVGGKHELQELEGLFNSESFNTELLNYVVGKGFTWEFISPNAPNFGGLW